jgi:hypothetical protein
VEPSELVADAHAPALEVLAFGAVVQPLEAVREPSAARNAARPEVSPGPRMLEAVSYQPSAVSAHTPEG